MKKILVLMTGGTRGCYSDNGIISLKKNNCRAVELFQEKFPDSADFEIIQPLNILSENLEKSHWETLINFLCETDISAYDGIIITHGSDTLSYTSAMLSICLRHFNIPVVITASNYIPDDIKSNAVENIRSAVTVINEFTHGIFTVYKNFGDDFTTVYLSSDITEADRFLGKFSSFCGQPFGKVSDDTFTKISSAALPEIAPPVFENKLSLKNDILMIRPYPSMLYSAIHIPESVKAVLHITYHSCTAKTNGNENALNFLELCKKQNIPFYITSVKDSSIYETSNTLLQNGALPIYNMSDEMSFSSLLIKYNVGQGISP